MTELKKELKYINMQAHYKENNEPCDIEWNKSIGTSGEVYLWADYGNVRCYLYLTKSGRVKLKTFSINGEEMKYREAIEVAGWITQ